MQLRAVVDLVNKLVGRGNHSYKDIEHYLDESIDNVNSDLGAELPLFSAVYANDFGDKTTAEALLVYGANSLANEYKRMPATYLRNYVAYYVAYKILQEQDEDPEVYTPKQMHALKWQQQIRARFGEFRMENTESVTVNGDVDDADSLTDVDYATTGLWPAD